MGSAWLLRGRERVSAEIRQKERGRDARVVGLDEVEWEADVYPEIFI
jgi:hypothetical protein